MNNVVAFSFIMLSLSIKEYFVMKQVFKEGFNKKILFLDIILLLSFALFSRKLPTNIMLTVSIVMDILLSVLYMAIILYHKYFSRVLNLRVIYYAKYIKTIYTSIHELLDKRYLLVFIDIPLLPLVVISNLYFKVEINSLPLDKIQSGCFLGLIIMQANYLYKVFNNVPIQVPNNIGILNYQFHEIFKTFIDMYKVYRFNKTERITPKKIREMKNISIKENPDYFGVAKDKHLIVVQVEALQSFPLFMKLGDWEVTPMLNYFAQESLYFENFYSQTAVGNTSDAEMMFNTSLYACDTDATMYKYCNREVDSFTKRLKNQGFTATALHTNDIGFYNRDKMYESMGYDMFFERSAFENRDIVSIGSSDEVLFEKSLDLLNSLAEQGHKVYEYIITLSSHYPFDIPCYKSRMDLPKELKWMDTTLVGKYLNAVNYLDYAFGQFIADLSRTGLLDECVLVVFGDHFGIKDTYLEGKNNIDNKAMETILGRHYETEDMFRVPCMIRLPYGEFAQPIKTAIGQIDLMPTLANIMGIDLKDVIHFGQDVLNYTDNLLGIRYRLPNGSYVSNEDFKVFDIKKDKDNKKSADIIKLMYMSDIYMKNWPIIKKQGQ